MEPMLFLVFAVIHCSVFETDTRDVDDTPGNVVVNMCCGMQIRCSARMLGQSKMLMRAAKYYGDAGDGMVLGSGCMCGGKGDGAGARRMFERVIERSADEAQFVRLLVLWAYMEPCGSRDAVAQNLLQRWESMQRREEIRRKMRSDADWVINKCIEARWAELLVVMLRIARESKIVLSLKRSLGILIEENAEGGMVHIPDVPEGRLVLREVVFEGRMFADGV